MINTGITSVIDGSGNMTAGIGVLASRYAFWAGGTLDDAANGTAAFVVGHNGVLKATGANIQGHIVATSGSFTGSIYASGGTIGSWTLDSYKMYRPSVWSNPHVYGTGVAATSTHGDPAFWAGFLGNLGNPWSHNANQDSSGNIIDGPWQNYTNFYVTNAGYLCAKNAYIKGHIEANSGTFKGTVSAGTIIQTSQSSATMLGGATLWPYNSTSTMFFRGNRTTGPYSRLILSETYAELFVYGADSDGDGALDNGAGIRINSNSGTGRLSGTWAYSSGSGSLSDQRRKNTIQDLDDRHSALFDNLRPRTYKYNEGTSDRTHIGFIAQEVSAAIESSGLTAQDAALVMEMQDYDDCGDPAETKTMFLRYEEIIALLVKEVQDMKKQLTEIQQAVGLLS